MIKPMQEQPRVLIIEDNDALRVMLFTILRHQPLAVDTAGSADEALEKVLTCDYALILIDMDLVNDEGEQFLVAFNEQRPDANSFVIAVRDPQADRYIDPKMVVAVLNKPLEIDTLAEVVRECAFLVPPPENPLPCPPAENDVRNRMERGSYLSN
jgi:DNA-binding NtrC family response regulator